MAESIVANAPWPYFDAEDQKAVADVLASGKVNYWTGALGREFEQVFAAYCGTKYAVAVANGTLALELALKALGLAPGDEVLVTSRTFIASASAIVACGGIPVCVDIDRDSQNVTAQTLEAGITAKTRGIIAVHLAGWPCDMDSINDLARAHGLFVLEDCAQAHGALYKGKPVGSLGDIAAFSFCQDKIMTTGGEGGMVTTNREDLWRAAWEYKDHGKSYDAVYNTDHPPGFRWLHHSFGSNYRLTEMQSALGINALKKLPLWTRTRIAHSEVLDQVARVHNAFRVPEIPDDIVHARYKYYVFVEPNALKSGWDRDRIASELVARGVPAFSGSCSEIYLEQAFSEPLRPTERLPVARELGETSLMLLVHPTISNDQMQQCAAVLDSVAAEASR